MSRQPGDRSSSDDGPDRSAIEAVVSGLERAWAAGDSQAWVSYFAEDADFTGWFGLYLGGRDAIAAVHRQIFESFYKSTELRLEVRGLRFLRPDVAVVHFDGRVVGRGERSTEYLQFVPVAVMTEADGRWRVAAFHNAKNTVLDGREGARDLHPAGRHFQPREVADRPGCVPGR